MMMMSFDNTHIAFRHRSDQDLRWSLWLFLLLSKPGLVSLGNRLLKMALSLHIPVGWMVKPTVYRQFVGGETIKECLPVVAKLARAGVCSILDYSVEGGNEEAQIEKTLAETLRTVEQAASDPYIPFSVFKPTAFGDLDFLAEDYAEHPDFQTAGLQRYLKRIDTLCNAAFKAGVPIMIDAEDVCFQDLVDDVVTQMMGKYNIERAIVFNTLQMYRHDRLAFLQTSIDHAKASGYFYGVKFVRGAYMERERRRAARLGIPSPICADKEATDKSYDAALKLAVEHIDVVSIFNGTHNEKSCYLLADLMKDKGIAMNDPRIWFSQLYGMSDHISFNLADAGYNVSKYLPYGPVKHVMPYLFRRAEENTSIAGQTGRELRLVRQETKRRKAGLK